MNYQACDILTLVGDKVSAKRSYRKIVSQLTQNLQGPHMVLTEDMKRLIGRARLAYVATVSSNGKPNLSPKGSIRALDDRRLGFADIESPGTVENLRRNPFIEINVVDPVLRRGYRFKGTAEVHWTRVCFGQLEAILASHTRCGTRSLSPLTKRVPYSLRHTRSRKCPSMTSKKPG